VESDDLRAQLARLLGWEDAHISFEAAVADLEPALRGVRPAGAPHSPWELLEHLRFTQHDILEFCRNPDYREPRFPDDYWPRQSSPPDEQAWDESVAAYRGDRAELVRLAEDPAVDLLAAIPHGSGQTCLRELLLVADHNSYHIGQLVVIRQLLGAWRSS
jgi:hypothetical protein